METKKKTECGKCNEKKNIDGMLSVTLYGGDEITICNDCLTKYYTNCAICGVFYADELREEMDMLTVDKNAGDTVCICCSPQKFVDACENLKDLRDSLN